MPRDDSPQTMLQKLKQLSKEQPDTLSAYAIKFVDDCEAMAQAHDFSGYTLGQVTYLERLYFNFFQ